MSTRGEAELFGAQRRKSSPEPQPKYLERSGENQINQL